MPRFIVGAVMLTASCGFSSIGGGSPQGNVSAGEDESSSSDEGAGTSQGIGAATGDTGRASDGEDEGVGTLTSPSGDDAETVGEAGEDGEDGEGSTGDTLEVDCAAEPFFKQIVAADVALVEPPMMTWTAPGEGMFAASETAFMGTAAFLWDAPCDGDYFVWARVWDWVPGSFENGPDSFYVALGEGGELTWHYGCQTATTLYPAWHWIRVQETISCLFDEDVITYSTSAGLQSFVFRGRETGTYDADAPPGQVAAVARILVTNDPSYTPLSNE